MKLNEFEDVKRRQPLRTSVRGDEWGGNKFIAYLERDWLTHVDVKMVTGACLNLSRMPAVAFFPFFTVPVDFLQELVMDLNMVPRLRAGCTREIGTKVIAPGMLGMPPRMGSVPHRRSLLHGSNRVASKAVMRPMALPGAAAGGLLSDSEKFVAGLALQEQGQDELDSAGQMQEQLAQLNSQV